MISGNASNKIRQPIQNSAQKKPEDWIWHKGIGHNSSRENITLCGVQGAAVFGIDEDVTCKRCLAKMKGSAAPTREISQRQACFDKTKFSNQWQHIYDAGWKDALKNQNMPALDEVLIVAKQSIIGTHGLTNVKTSMVTNVYNFIKDKLLKGC